MHSTILVINAGSSSIKFALWPAHALSTATHASARGVIAGIGRGGRFVVSDAQGQKLHETETGARTHDEAFAALLEWIASFSAGGSVAAIGHRVVHGGRHYTQPVLCDERVLADIEALTSLAPLHQPFSVAGVRLCLRHYPRLPQVLCFDTAFHCTQPPVARRIALPRALHDEGVVNYGFHGLSYEYIARVLPEHSAAAARGRTVVAHLGHGASLCAVREGRSIATTMTFSPLDGLPMARRCGSIDPGVVLYLLQHKGMSADAVSHLLNSESGLLGVSGLSDDMRELLASDDVHAREAVDLFVYRSVRAVGSLTAALGGLDAIVFTAGVGEHSAEIRGRICHELQWLGLELDPEANAAAGPRISPAQSRVSAWVIPTNEEIVIARHTARLAQLV